MDTQDARTATVILAAGDYPKSPAALSVLRGAERVICCDGAAAAYVASEGRQPWRVVGDCDSLPAALRRDLGPALVHIAEQETNDLTKAVSYAADRGYRAMTILGATGRREDHTLGNISLLVDYMRRGLDVQMITDHGTFIPCRDTYRSDDVTPGTQVSIFSFGATRLSADGLRYPLHDLTNWWQGTLNEVTASSLTIRAEGDFLVFINSATENHRE